MTQLLIYLLSILLVNHLIYKKKLILSDTGLSHQSLVNNSIPLTGGIFFLLPTIYLFLPGYFFFIIAYCILFFLGLLSDLKIFESAKKRFLIQLLIILFFVFISRLEVTPTKIIFIDEIIYNTYWSYFFTTFCLMILINGSNFIDGLNGLFLGYFCLIIFILFKLDLIYLINFSNTNFFYFIIVALFLFMLNFSNKLFLGDNGAYSLSFLLGFLLIKIYNYNQNISPYFIILLLWYPCFENLFSIIRKFIYKKNPLEPDTEHLHQKLFLLFKKKFSISNLQSNVMSSMIILFFNFLIFYISSKAISHTFFQLSLLSTSVILYLLIYRLINKQIKKN